MTIARLCEIPCITVEASDTTAVITADDGFRLVAKRVDRMLGSFWVFSTSDAPSAIRHFHLRYLIHMTLNYPA